MRFKKTMAVIITAALLASSLTAMGSFSASADEVDTSIKSVDTLVKDDYATYPTYSGNDLGATYTPDATTFKVWAPTATDVKLHTYLTGGEAGVEDDMIEFDMELDKSTGVWSVKLEGYDYKNTYYTYFVKNDLNPDGIEVVDVYAKAAGVNGNRAMVVDLDSTDPEGWNDDNFQRAEEATDATVWEVHIKDFSYDPESGVSDQYKGKYMAFTELETTLNNAGDIKTCMNYLKDLGISYVQINPMYDFGSVDEAGDDTQFNWGYDPKNYNVPEGSYSTNPYDGNVRINEMKQMIKALHDNGIGVIMDVVYNHTYQSTDSWFNLTVPGYYYRQNEDGSWSNGSGCGNDTASEREMFKKFMVDSVTYWADEYHIDGFRFDLMGLHDCDTMDAVREALDEIDTKIIMYGEGWTLGTANDKINWAGNKTSLCTQAKAMRISDRIGFFNDDARDSLKGKAYDDLTSRGYVSGSSSYANNLYNSIIGHFKTSNWKTQNPGQNVMYSCCHDNQTLWDRLVASNYGTDTDKYGERNESFVASNKLSGAIVLTSQGIPFMLAGEEFARTKYGDHNSYRSSPDINMLDWSRVEEYADIVSYYKGLIDIRENFDAFSDGTRTTGESMVKLDVPSGVIGYSVNNLSTAQNQWDSAVVYFNGNLNDSVEVTLPGGSAVTLGDVNEDGKITASDALAVLRYTIDLNKLSDSQLAVADVNGDGKVTSADALKIQRYTIDLDQIDSTSAGGTEYVVIADGQTAGLSAIDTVSGKAVLPPTSSLILIPKDTYEAVGKSDAENAYVVVNHIDKDTNKVLYKTTIKGTAGQKYSTQPANDLLVEYDVDTVPANAQGNMTEGTTEVNYYYTPFAGGMGTLTVRYVDQDGKDLTDPIVTTARNGSSYTTSAKTFTWYDLDTANYPTNASGAYSKEGVEVVYRYIYNKPERTKELITSTIHVKIENAEFTPYIHLWDEVTLPDSTTWPGYQLTEKDGDGWYIFTFQNYNVYNWILNDNQGSQTADMAASGDIWVIANGKASNVSVYSFNPDIR